MVETLESREKVAASITIATVKMPRRSEPPFNSLYPHHFLPLLQDGAEGSTMAYEAWARQWTLIVGTPAPVHLFKHQRLMKTVSCWFALLAKRWHHINRRHFL